jgi:hypothetical protein
MAKQQKLKPAPKRVRKSPAKVIKSHAEEPVKQRRSIYGRIVARYLQLVKGHR